jgi:hypothetical protein
LIWTEKELNAALRTARASADRLMRPVAVVANSRPKWFEMRPRAWRIEASPTAADTILIADVLPRLWSRETVQADCRIMSAYPEAAAALREMLAACVKRADGTPRPEDERFEMIRRLCDWVERQENTPHATDALPHHARRADLPGYQEPRS